MKKVIYSVIAAGLFAFGFTSCSPQDSDSHSLGGSPVETSALSISANVSADETGQENVVTVTNASKAQGGVRYYISLDGKSLVETPAGGSITQIVKKKGEYTAQLYAFSACDQQMISTSYSIAENWKDPSASDEPEGWMGFTAGTNLLAEWQPDNNYWFSPSDWSGGLDPGFDGDIHSGLNFTIPANTGSDQWQAQVHIEHNGPTLSAGKNYDFSVGAPIGTAFTVERVFLSEHNDANVAPFDYDSSKNMLKDQPFGADFRFWFADGGWGQIADPEHDGDSTSEFSLTIPNGIGGDQWQGQVHIPFDNVKLSAGKKYNFSIVVIADNNIPGLTVKPQNDADDNSFLSADRHAVAANVPTAIVLTSREGFDGKFRLCLDFGGTPAGTNVTILDMYLAEE